MVSDYVIENLQKKPLASAMGSTAEVQAFNAAVGPLDLPGGGCTDPRSTHPHWCGFCGAELLFSRAQCARLYTPPRCPRCGEKRWRTEVDELAAPDYQEGSPRV